MKVGEVVVLRSGSAQMTIEKFAKDGRAVCVWYSARQKMCRCAFSVEAIKPMPR